MKIFKQSWLYCFAIAIIIFFVLANYFQDGVDFGFARYIIGFVTITPLIVGGLFSLTMSIINHFKNNQPTNKD